MRRGETTLRWLLRPIQHLLDDPAITEIVVNVSGEVGTEANGVFSWHAIPEFDFNRLEAIAITAASLLSTTISAEHPICKTVLPDGQRMTVCRPPVTAYDNIIFCIRKPPKTARKFGDPDMEDLLSMVNAEPPRRSGNNLKLIELYHQQDWYGLLDAAVAARCTIGAVGLMGSGKTDFLRRLIDHVPQHDRLATVEGSPEFGDIGPKNRIQLFYDDERPGRTSVDIVRVCRRLYPKTIAFQEVLGAEAFTLAYAVFSGANSFTSWHAPPGGEIEAMALMMRQHDACANAPQEYLIKLVRQCFDIIVYFDRTPQDGFKVRRLWFKAVEEEITA